MRDFVIEALWAMVVKRRCIDLVPKYTDQCGCGANHAEFAAKQFANTCAPSSLYLGVRKI